MRDVAGVQFTAEQNELLQVWLDLYSACGWFFPFDGLCVMSERATVHRFDESRRLHCADGPAVAFRDGYSLYAWHGTRVPERVIIAPESYTADELRAETNTEVIRALGEKQGWSWLLERLGSREVDAWVDPVTRLSYALYEAQISGERCRFVRKQSPLTKQGTQPEYLEPVPAELTTAQSARKFQAMSSFVDDDEREIEKLVEYCNQKPELVYDWEA